MAQYGKEHLCKQQELPSMDLTSFLKMSLRLECPFELIYSKNGFEWFATYQISTLLLNHFKFQKAMVTSQGLMFL